MKYSAVRQHKKINANCERMMREYLEFIHQENTIQATVLRKRITKRYGKQVFDMMGVTDDDQ